jgi:hypothetical protein
LVRHREEPNQEAMLFLKGFYNDDYND